jgi:hypothetical protein
MTEIAAASAIVFEAVTLLILAIATAAIATGVLVIAAEQITELVERWRERKGGGS